MSISKFTNKAFHKWLRNQPSNYGYGKKYHAILNNSTNENNTIANIHTTCIKNALGIKGYENDESIADILRKNHSARKISDSDFYKQLEKLKDELADEERIFKTYEI